MTAISTWTHLAAQTLTYGWHACVQFQGMLWRLLGHALDLSNPESDTLIEEALRLLVSVLNNATAFMPALQVRRLLSHIAGIFDP